MAEQLPEDWRITIDVPLAVSDAERERLFEAVVDVVHGWEPEDRDGWDAFMVAGTEDHSVEAYAERLREENELLKRRMSAADGAEDGWHNLATNGVTAAAKWKAERDEARRRASSWWEAAKHFSREQRRALSRIEVALALHSSEHSGEKDPEDRCFECAELTPCPTRRALEGKP